MTEVSCIRKALIVDDEKNRSQTLKTYLETFDLGIEVVGTTDNGHTAMKIARDEKPDVILADIYMPTLCDLNFVDAMHDCLPDTLVVVMTGYRDFEYVRRALRLKVFDYLLKPISSRQLYETCCNAFLELEKNNPQKEFLDWINRHSERNIAFIMEQLLADLIDGRMVNDNLYQQLNYLGIDVLSCTGVMVASPLEVLENAVTDLQTSLIDPFESQIKKEMLRFSPCVTFQHKKKYIVSLFPAEETTVKSVENYITASLDGKWKNNAIVKTAYIGDVGKNLTRTFTALVNDLNHAGRLSPLVALIKNYMEKNYHKSDICVRNVAEEYNISVSYVGRLLRKELGCSFVEYLTKIRIEKAMKLLRDPSLKIRQISESVGYEGQHYFSNIFKKTIGVPPGEYRKNLARSTRP